MTQELSSLMDGELDTHEAELVIRGCCGSEELKEKWHAYHVIGDAMRGEGPCMEASRRRIIEALRGEPTVLAPRWRRPANAGRIAFAAAASVATVAVVGWIGMQDRAMAPGPVVAKSAPAGVPAAPIVAANVVPLNNVRDYMVVHQQVPSEDFYRPVSDQAAAGR